MNAHKTNHHNNQNHSNPEHLELITEFDSCIKEMNLLSKDPHTFILDYISVQRNKIVTRREKMLAKVHTIAEDMMAKLKQFEEKYRLSSSSTNNIYIDRDQLDKLEKQRDKWKEEIRNPSLSPHRLIELTGETRKLLAQLQQKCFECKNVVLKGEGCFFEPKNSFVNLSNEDFGRLIFDEFKTTDLFENQRTFFNGIVKSSNRVGYIHRVYSKTFFFTLFKTNNNERLILKRKYWSFTTRR